MIIRYFDSRFPFLVLVNSSSGLGSGPGAFTYNFWLIKFARCSVSGDSLDSPLTAAAAAAAAAATAAAAAAAAAASAD